VCKAVEVCPGDKIQVLANRKKLDLVNGQVLTVKEVHPSGALHTQEGITVPVDFKQWTHGYVVTSPKSQGRSSRHVVGAAARLDEKSAYVLTSRGRESCTLHTPDKAALIAHLPQANRKAALDVLAVTPRKPKAVQSRPKAWETAKFQARKIRAKIAQKEENMRHAVRRWRGERHLSADLQKKVQFQQSPPARSLTREAIRSIESKYYQQGISK
jgi:hypothetical protein